MNFEDGPKEKPRSATPDAEQKELLDAIRQLDRKLARKLIIDEAIKPVGVEEDDLLRFLHVAVQSRDPPLVAEILKQKPDLKNGYGSEILWIVAEDGDTRIATMLVCAGAELNCYQLRDRRERSLLHALIASDSPKKHQLAILMMDYGAYVDAEDAEGDTPLVYAVTKSSFDLAEELINRGARVDQFVVAVAIFNPRATELILMLLKGNFPFAKTDHISDKISVMLFYLTHVVIDESKIMPVLEALKDLGMVENSMYLYSAALCGKQQMIEFFLNNGYGIEDLSIMLHLSTTLNQCCTAELLIRKGADINYRITLEQFGYENQCPIHTACENGSLPNVKLLLRLGVDINVIDDLGFTPFALIEEDTILNDLNREIIKHFAMLTSKGLKVNERDMQVVHAIADFQHFYEQCSDELKNMKKLKIFNHISIHTILVENIRILSWLTRNSILVNNFKEVQLRELFPLYRAEVEWKFRNAEDRKQLLLSQDNEVCEVLSEAVPNLVVAMIILCLYMDNVEAFQFNMNV